MTTTTWTLLLLIPIAVCIFTLACIRLLHRMLTNLGQIGTLTITRYTRAQLKVTAAVLALFLTAVNIFPLANNLVFAVTFMATTIMLGLFNRQMTHEFTALGRIVVGPHA